MSDLGGALKAIRIGGGMAQRQVAACAGISASHLSRVERGSVEPPFKWAQYVSYCIGEYLYKDVRALA